MPEEEAGTGSGEEQAAEETTEETSEEVPSEGDEATTSEAEGDVKDDRPEKNRIAEAQRKQRKAERQVAELRQEFQEWKTTQNQGTPTPPLGTPQTEGFTEDQLGAAHTMDPAKYGWSAIKQLVDMKLKEATTGMSQENQKEALVANSERQAAEMFPDLLDEDSDFREKVATELNQTQEKYRRAGHEAPPDMVLNIASRVALQEGIQPNRGDNSSWDEVTRTRNASRGEAPPAQPKPAKKTEPELNIPEKSTKLAERMDRKKFNAFVKSDKVSQQALRMLEEGK